MKEKTVQILWLLSEDGHLGNLLPNGQTNLRILPREINSLYQWVEARESQQAEGLDCINCLEQELWNLSVTWRAQLTSTPAPTEPFREVVHQYTDTLCATQKQENLTNSLLQDIAIFSEQDSTKLEECLMDIETAAGLINESQVKLAKAKSRGLTLTLVMEVINSEKTWDEIKDLLRLKLCNANIHTYTSHLVDQWQREMESLAPFVHQFKTEAKKCNFMNDIATIRIFIKGLRNAHSLAARIYEKDPQTLKNAIKEVEKLNAAQQLTVTIILSLTFNMTSNEEDWMFSMPRTRTHCTTLPSHQMLWMWWLWTYHHGQPSQKYALQEHWHHITRHTETTAPDWALDTIRKTEKKETSPDHNLGTADITAPAIMTCTEATSDHNSGMGTATMEAAQDIPIQHTKDTVANPAMTHHTSHTTNHQHTTSSLSYHSQDCSRSHSHPSYRSSKYNSHWRGSHSLRSYSNQGTWKSHLRRNTKVQIEEHPLDYYSSEDNSTDLGEESESLN